MSNDAVTPVEVRKGHEETPAPSRQEMFNRAYLGLKSQGWMCAVARMAIGHRCAYLTKGGLRCAWGWVDPEGTALATGVVHDLRRDGIGIAAGLSDDDETFAEALQRAHDDVGLGSWYGMDPVEDAQHLEASLHAFATTWELTVPPEVPQ